MIFLDKNNGIALYVQIYYQIRNDILAGKLKENHILTGSRTLAKTLGISRNTVDNAYCQLYAEGYIYSKKGIGYAVMELPELNIHKSANNQKIFHKSKLQIRTKQKSIKYDLTNSSFTSDLFPKSIWKKLTPECLDKLDSESQLNPYQDKHGSYYLRNQLLVYLQKIRGVSCNENQIVITCGIQQSLDIICKLLSSKNASILMEEPGFDKAIAVFINNGMNVNTIPVDEQGLITSYLGRHENICAAYTTPSHQFPTGATMPIRRRYELLEWASKSGVYIIEDDFDSELRYYARPIPSMQSIDINNNVIYLGTFSKAVSPSIRMGYMILPPQLLSKYDEIYKNYNSTVPLLNQLIIGKLIETGHYDRHIRKLNQIFKKRLELFYAELSDVENKIKISSNGSGQYFLLAFHETVSQNELIQTALACGVKVYSTMNFWQEKAACPPNTLFLGFSQINLEDIPDCVSRLKAAWRKWL